MQGKIQNDLGAVALLFNVNDAARFAALIQEQEFSGATELSDDDRAMLREIADPALGGGVTNLMERFGRNVEQLDEVQIQDNGAENAVSPRRTHRARWRRLTVLLLQRRRCGRRRRRPLQQHPH